MLKAVNPETQDLADEDIFATAAPDLFRAGFETRMKERADSMKLLHASQPPSTSKKFFMEAVPLAPRQQAARTAGGDNRGRRQPWAKKNQASPKK